LSPWTIVRSLGEFRWLTAYALMYRLQNLKKQTKRERNRTRYILPRQAPLS
jgi:hypothetical protein